MRWDVWIHHERGYPQSPFSALSRWEIALQVEKTIVPDKSAVLGQVLRRDPHATGRPPCNATLACNSRRCLLFLFWVGSEPTP